MFTKLVLVFVAVQQISNGLPADNVIFRHPVNKAKANPAYDVQQFLSPRIVGGVEAPEGYARHLVALIIGYYVRALVCGGSLISGRHVLTAAHCIDPFVIWDVLSEHFTGVVGSNYWNSTKMEVRFSGYKIHPDWDWAEIKNDIGILVISEELQFNKKDGPMPIAIHFGWISSANNASVAGWGRTGVFEDIPDRFQVLYNLRILTVTECAVRMEEALEVFGFLPPVDPRIEICTFHSRGHGMCNGDSGSPLVMTDGHGKRKMVGIVSWGLPCANGFPDMFVRVSAFLRFINEGMRLR